MKATFICFICLLSTAFSYHLDLKQKWQEFKLVHDRRYSSLEEETMRMNIFAKNMEMVHKHNLQYARGLKSFTMKLHKSSDKSHEELYPKKSFEMPKNTPNNQFVSSLKSNEMPKEWDWREKGVVTRVKDQGSCASCYAFSAVGAIESHHAIKTGKLVPLSEENIVDCSQEYGNTGCDTGHYVSVFQYVMDHGINTEESYPYNSSNYIPDHPDNICTYKKEAIGATIRNYSYVESNNEQQLLEVVATIGPVSVALSTISSFDHYEKGVYDDPKCTWYGDSDHAVLVVGYGTEDGKDYWIVKNSDGDEWGEKGYIRMIRNKNICGIAHAPTYPIV